MRRVAIFLTAMLALTSAASAQSSGGQFCVRAYEDRNGNATLDPGEPLLTSGVAANLLNVDGVTLETALLEESPTAAQGIVCFQRLAAGQYTILATSADLTATTPATFTATIADGQLPTVFEFGGRRISQMVAPGTSTTTLSPEAQRQEVGRIVLAALGAVVVVGVMATLGLIIYWFGFRQRPVVAPRPVMDSRVTTGVHVVDMADLQAVETGEYPETEITEYTATETTVHEEPLSDEQAERETDEQAEAETDEAE